MDATIAINTATTAEVVSARDGEASLIAKIDAMDLISTTAQDTSLYHTAATFPPTMGYYYLIFNSTGNDIDSSGTFTVEVKNFK